MNTRKNPSLDYKTFHEKGIKVYKSVPGGENSDLKMTDLTVVEEAKIREDIEHNFKIYAINDLDNEEEIKEGIEALNNLSKTFRHIHVDLKTKIPDYNVKYNDFDEISAKIVEYIKVARKKVKAVRLDDERIQEEKERVRREDGEKVRLAAEEEEKKESLKIEENRINLKITQFEKLIDINGCQNISVIDEYIVKMEEFIKEYFDLSRNLEVCLGDEYSMVYETKFQQKTQEMGEEIRMAKLLRQKILEISEGNKHVEFERIKIQSHILSAQNLSSEIELRCESLDNTFDQDLVKFGDYHILEISKNNSYDGEFNCVLEKITELASLVTVGGNEVQDLFDTATCKRDMVADKKKAFQKNLQSILTERDITPDKLKNASTLKIELPKFSGYDCKTDFYTFKSEFTKLVEPTIQKKYLADYLKRNYLSGIAFTLVEKENEYSQIWEMLLQSFGNARLLLQNKLGDLDKIGGLWKVRDEIKLTSTLARLINSMRDLVTLAHEHDLEGQLYEGGGLERIIFMLGDNRHKKFRSRNLKFSGSKKDEWEKLLAFLKEELQLREKLALDHKTAKLLGLGKKDEKEENCKISRKSYNTGHESVKCSFCNNDGHTVITTTKGNKIIPYYVCESFVNMSPADRYAKLKSKNLCTTCIYPGAVKGNKHKCWFLNFCCPHPSHQGGEKLHVLLCNEHKKQDENVKLFEKFKDKFITNCKVPLPQYTKYITCFSEMVGVTKSEGLNLNIFSDFPIEPEICDSAIFQLQTIHVNGIALNLFFDSGCGDMIVKKSALEKLVGKGRAKQVVPGPIVITGVGEQKTVCEDGIFSICLPLHNGQNAVLSGLCLPKITSEFPIYELANVENHLKKKCKATKRNLLNLLPKLPAKVGGNTDILIGTKYAKYFPKLIFETETGLGIFESFFVSPGGSRGIVSGPYHEFSKIERSFKGMHVGKSAYFSDVVCKVRDISRLSNDVSLLGCKSTLRIDDVDAPICCSLLHEVRDCVSGRLGVSEMPKLSSEDSVADGSVLPNLSTISSGESLDGASSEDIASLLGSGSVAAEGAYAVKRPPKCVKQFDQVERAGTEVTYRCVDCRDCVKCKDGGRVDAISIQEEIEQALIERSVEVDASKCVTTAVLPFVVDPDNRLGASEPGALKVFRGQLKKLNSEPENKMAVLISEKKLQDLGFVDYFSNLDDEQKAAIMDAIVRYFLPWRAVFNENSQTTACRLVFDASQPTQGGCSLNSLLAKGANSMNKLVEIMIRWLTWGHAFHTDISKMYNVIQLQYPFWRYQLYLWSESLNLNDDPVWKVIKTLIYGVRSSGNLAECGLRRTAELSKVEFPKAYDVVMHDTYVDDCMSGTESHEQTLQLTDELQVTLIKGGFSLKGFAMSGEDPPESLSGDQESVLVGGLRWFPKGDFLMLNIKELNFNKKIRGKKSLKNVGLVPEKLTKRDCVSIASEVFDIFGYVAPILGGIKLDISVLHQRRLDWDDPIPSELKNIWIANFNLIKELGNLKFHRAVIPVDAISLDVETIDTADATENLICSAIYARYKRKNGEYSCQLIFARTKIIHDLTIPRAELAAALLNANTGYIVRSSLKGMHKKAWKVTDSQVVLYWLNCTKSALKMWVRNRVKEISRLSDYTDWYYITSKDMIADLGTRKGVKVEEVGPNSPWIQGYPWMREAEEKFPIKTVNEVVLSGKEKNDANKEKVITDFMFENCLVTKYVQNDVASRYKFSNYLVHPSKFRFRTVLRILAIAFLFLQKISKKRDTIFDFLKKREFRHEKLNNDKYIVSQYNAPGYTSNTRKVAVIHLSEDILNAAKSYFFLKATLEVKQFVHPSKYEKISILREGILYFTGRILPSQEVDGKFALSDACLDLSASSFCVPITDALSPVAYAIVSETHWYHPDVSHGGVESVLRLSQCTAFIIGGRALVKSFKTACAKCRLLHKKAVRAAMGPLGKFNLCIAPPFFYCQTDLCGPFNAYSPVNKRATLKVWFVVFCCTVTGALDCRIMENYNTDSFLLAFERFACRFGYPKTILPDEGSQLVKGCQDMVISFSDIKHKMSVEYGIEFKTCPVGAHNVHGKVERKIREIRRSLLKTIGKNRLSVLQWETLGQQVSNSINNNPIGLGNKVDMLENLDILTPNRLILGRNNYRNPTAPIRMENDLRRIIESNNEVFDSWFKVWLTSYVPLLIEKPKWFSTERHVTVGDVVLFLKSEQEFDRQYQYGIVIATFESRDGLVRTVEVEYQNHRENIKRRTKRSVRDLIVIHQIDEIGISKELHELANTV